jgi:hypothetical protein
MPWFYGLCWFSVAIFAIHLAFLAYVRASVGKFSDGTVAGVVILSLMPFVALVSVLGLLVHLFYIRVFLGISTYEYLKRQGEVRGQKMLDKEAQRLESKREEIEKEQARIREEWRKNREKELAERKARQERKGLLPELMSKTSSSSSNVPSPNHVSLGAQAGLATPLSTRSMQTSPRPVSSAAASTSPSNHAGRKPSVQFDDTSDEPESSKTLALT